MRQIPTVMVSSTLYDLRQLRQDLTSFLQDSLGYRALLSELPSFPVSPDLDTTENCRRRVEEDADVLLLVVGGRYGSIDDRSGKSITNLEVLGGTREADSDLCFRREAHPQYSAGLGEQSRRGLYQCRRYS